MKYSHQPTHDDQEKLIKLQNNVAKQQTKSYLMLAIYRIENRRIPFTGWWIWNIIILLFRTNNPAIAGIIYSSARL